MTIDDLPAEQGKGEGEQEESIAGLFLFAYLMGSRNMREALNRELKGRAPDFFPDQIQIMHRGVSNILGAYVQSLGRTPTAAELSQSVQRMAKGIKLPLDYLDQIVSWHLAGSPGLFEAGADQLSTAAAMSFLMLIELDLPTAKVRELIRQAERDTRALGIELTPMWKRTSAQALEEPDAETADQSS